MPLKINREKFDSLPPAAKTEVEAAIAEIFDATQANPLIGFFPGDKQKPALAMDTDIMAVFAGNRYGKTCVGAVKNLIDALDEEDVPEHLRKFKKWQPPFYCRVLAPDFTDYIDAVILPEIRKWCPPNALAGGSWDKAYSEGRRTLTFRNGSQFRFFSYKQDKGQLGGSSVHRVWFDEPPPQTHRNECLARLIQYDGDELFTMTPLHGVSWLEMEVYKKRTEPHITVIKGSGLDNPVNSESAVMRIINQYPEEERQARLYGDFVHFAGRVLPEFNERDHVVDTILPHHLAGHEVVVGIDPGWDHGFAVAFCAFDVEGNCLIFDEIEARGKTVEQVIVQMRSKLGYWNVTPAYFVIDSAGEQTSVITGYSVRTEFRRLGIPTRKAKNTAHSWGPSVDRLRSMFGYRVEEVVDGETKMVLKPRLKMTRDCPVTIDQTIAYHHKYDADDLSTEDKNPRPYKKFDDLVDAYRYVVMSRTYQDPIFSPQEIEEERPDLTKVAAMGWHLEQMRRIEEEQNFFPMHGHY